MRRLRKATLGLLLAGLPVSAFRVAKSDFPLFAGVLACGERAVETCSGAADGFVLHGLAGQAEIPDPSSSELTAGGRIVLGVLEGKPFSWPRYSVDFPAAGKKGGFKWVVLNELSSGDQNRVFLSRWKVAGDSLEFIKVFPRPLPLGLGETTVQTKAPLPDGSLLLVLKGDGADAGVRLQDFRLLRLTAPDQVDEVLRRTNRSETPVSDILEKINADQPVEAVMDSTLTCAVVAGRKAASGGPVIRFTTTRVRLLYTKAGPEETPLGSSSQDVDIWKEAKARKYPR